MDNTVQPYQNESCVQAKIIHLDLQINLAELGQVILSFITLLLVIIAILTHKKYKLPLHYNFMLLITNIIILYVIHSVLMLAIQLRRYETEGSNYVILSTVIVWSLAVAINCFMAILALKDPAFQNPLAHMSLTTNSNSVFLISNHLFLMALVIITAIIDYYLLYTNRKNKSNVEDYSLSRSYQIHENIIVMKLIWPLDVCFAVVFVVYLSVASYLRFIRDRLTEAQFVADYEVIYMLLPMHSIVTLLLYLHFVKNNKTRVTSVIEPGDHAQIHFDQLASIWAQKAVQKQKAR
ncbi:serpentine type 7TM GPCR receptor class ab chemoreceptor domain-containing protein [Ditylenchus destructor]|uniref:Serpentine type 7TM GPCR receptor class ab chemoreceptor domain-containing protein n=1 Tax=Ditylenchus destructor TaxID=166010 RepID=A0AAD4MW50_9BILA|nr:serpentine type 7TM GPCR receptor class ab chemoreceptor domain-containing protein [Ditylenchus destructor]